MSSLARAVALMAIAISSTFPLSHAATTPVIVPAAPAPAPVAVLVPSVFADSSSTDTPPPAPALVSAKSTTSNASLATDYASLFYQLYRQNSTSVPAMKLKQPVPDEVAKRIANYSLTFDTLPGLMQRALLWESGYLVGDQDMLARVYTRCGASTASLGVPLEQMNASGCFLEQCDVGSSDVFVRTCRPEQLRAVAQCAVTAVDTTSNSTIWRPAVSVAMAMTTTRAPANKTGITFVPELQVRRHEWRDPLNDDFVYVYAIHTSANDTGVCLSTEQDPSTNGETIPCVPYQRTMDADWCMPKPQPLVTRWLTDYADEVQQHGSDNPTPEHTPAMINNEDRAARNDQKDSHGVVVDKNFQYDGKSSDLAQQYYRRHLAGDVVSKMSIDGTLPREIQQRLTDVSLAFDDLPPMLQRALVWDTGFAYGDGSTLAGIYTKCGLGMADIAVSLRAFNNAGCAEQNCTDGSTGTVFKRSLYCTGDQMTSASLCASTDVSTPVHIAMWADGGHEDMLPDVTVTRHAWEDRNQSYLIYGIHTVRNEAAYSQCPEKGSLIIPCVQYTDDSRDSWCRPKPGQLVTSWLKQVAKEKQFNLLYLIPILLGVALATTALAVCIRRRSLRRPDQKDETARSSMASSRPFFSVRGAGPTPNNGDVDAMFVRRNSHDGFRTSSDASSDSSGDSMDNLSTNTLVTTWQLQWLLHVQRLTPLGLPRARGALWSSDALLHPWGLLAAVFRTPTRWLDRVTRHHHRYLDRVTATMTQNSLLFPNGFFCDGWGDLNTPVRLRKVLQSHRMRDVNELAADSITWQPKRVLATAGVCIQEGSFPTTLPNAKQYLPDRSLDAYCELVTPLGWHEDTESNKLPTGAADRPLVVLLPGTGEHGFLHRRTSLAIPLARKGVATLILEGPYYGRRKPAEQKGSKLRRVSDLPILGQATIEEAKSLLAYFRQHHGFEYLVVAGSSMGGLHAAMIASVFPHAVGATAWLAPPSAVPVFADGLLSASCNWNSLYRAHELKMLDNMLQGQAAAVATDDASFEDEDPVQQAKKRMRMFLSITDIDNFRPPVRTDAVVFAIATEDEYIGFPESQWKRLREQWKPAHFRYLTTGHVSGILLEQDSFRETIMDVIKILKKDLQQRETASGAN
ncbi:TPA: hypothetical protein N0F65_008591 [Lagenidium giganteum]|uniref:Uncharacterized protein n=1 Tax=Lagenidium giganteum TaxID=4803 RepID=A0AAV2Z365_9STRA|nr:TPA: hypothetical protein N0F65_008591 [Lagenidium giganteum]